MAKDCCAPNCTNNSTEQPELHFYRIPARSRPNNLRRRWLLALSLSMGLNCGELWEPLSKHTYLCSAHFITGQKSDHPKHQDYVPSKFQHKIQKMKGNQQLESQGGSSITTVPSVGGTHPLYVSPEDNEHLMIEENTHIAELQHKILLLTRERNAALMDREALEHKVQQIKSLEMTDLMQQEGQNLKEEKDTLKVEEETTEQQLQILVPSNAAHYSPTETQLGELQCKILKIIKDNLDNVQVCSRLSGLFQDAKRLVSQGETQKFINVMKILDEMIGKTPLEKERLDECLMHLEENFKDRASKQDCARPIEAGHSDVIKYIAHIAPSVIDIREPLGSMIPSTVDCCDKEEVEHGMPMQDPEEEADAIVTQCMLYELSKDQDDFSDDKVELVWQNMDDLLQIVLDKVQSESCLEFIDLDSSRSVEEHFTSTLSKLTLCGDDQIRGSRGNSTRKRRHQTQSLLTYKRPCKQNTHVEHDASISSLAEEAQDDDSPTDDNIRYVAPIQPKETEEWLDDQMVDTFLKYLSRELKREVFLPGSWLSEMWIHGNYEELYLKEDFRTYEYIVIPRCFHGHWMMLVADVKKATVGVVNSISNSDQQTNLKTLLQHWREFNQRRQDVLDCEGIDWREIFIRCGQQQDTSSCGVFILMAAESILKGEESDQYQQSDVRIYRLYISMMLDYLRR